MSTDTKTVQQVSKTKEVAGFFRKSILVSKDVSIRIENNKVIVKGPKAELQRAYPSKIIEIVLSDGKLEVKPRDKTAFARMLVGTYLSHIKNMIAGTQNLFTYTLKIVFTHFPITVVVSGTELQVQNFLGEKKPRKITLPSGVKVSVQNEFIKIESADLELAGKAATLIEQATRISGRDRRVYQDGIYITQKGKGK